MWRRELSSSLLCRHWSELIHFSVNVPNPRQTLTRYTIHQAKIPEFFEKGLKKSLWNVHRALQYHPYLRDFIFRFQKELFLPPPACRVWESQPDVEHLSLSLSLCIFGMMKLRTDASASASLIGIFNVATRHFTGSPMWQR